MYLDGSVKDHAVSRCFVRICLVMYSAPVISFNTEVIGTFANAIPVNCNSLKLICLN